MQREGKRWEDMERKEGNEEERWKRLREEVRRSKKNKSGVPYNMINLRCRRQLFVGMMKHNAEQVQSWGRTDMNLKSRRIVISADVVPKLSSLGATVCAVGTAQY